VALMVEARWAVPLVAMQAGLMVLVAAGVVAGSTHSWVLAAMAQAARAAVQEAAVLTVVGFQAALTAVETVAAQAVVQEAMTEAR